MTASRDRILARLRQAREVQPLHRNPVRESDREWRARQPGIADLAQRFVQEQQAVGSEVRRAASWDALPGIVADWLAELGVNRVMTGAEPQLEGLRDTLRDTGGFTLLSYEREMEAQREEIFAADCGITTSRGAIADTGSVIMVPSPQEPRLLSLAMPVHLVLVERSRLFATLADYIESGEYQAELPANLVLVSGASRTADIELTLAMGVHGPKTLLVALIG